MSLVEESNEQKHSYAKPQQQLQPIPLTIRQLVDYRESYVFRPEFQRQYVWGLEDNQAFIDTILSAGDFDPLTAYKGFDKDGRQSLGLVDGFQRVTTIRRFVDNKFRTWTINQKNHAEPNSEDLPVCPGKYFRELDLVAQNYFLDYVLTIRIVACESLQKIATYFLRINHHMPLSAAEKLNAYTSKAKDAARQIEAHPFWQECYDGKKNRNQLLQSSLHLLQLELMYPKKITVELLGGGYIHSLAYGKYDDLITDDVVGAVCQRLDELQCIYRGTQFTTRSVVIPMYQSLFYLEQAGYSVTTSDTAKLTMWIMNILSETRHPTSLTNYNRPIQQILRENSQKQFWDIHLKTVMALLGVRMPDIIKQQILPGEQIA